MATDVFQNFAQVGGICVNLVTLCNHRGELKSVLLLFVSLT